MSRKHYTLFHTELRITTKQMGESFKDRKTDLRRRFTLKHFTETSKIVPGPVGHKANSESLSLNSKMVLISFYVNQILFYFWVVINKTVCREGSCSKQSSIMRADTP